MDLLSFKKKIYVEKHVRVKKLQGKKNKDIVAMLSPILQCVSLIKFEKKPLKIGSTIHENLIDQNIDIDHAFCTGYP